MKKEEIKEKKCEKKDKNVKEVDLKAALSCLQKYTDFSRLSVKEVAHGCYGHLYLVCEAYEKDDSKCKKIVKIVIQGRPEIIAKEIAICQMLHNSGLTPNLYNVFHCDGYLFIIMDRYDSNLQNNAADLFKDHEANLRRLEGKSFPWQPYLYREEDLLEMFRIARDLGIIYDIIHGDLKPDQYLWRDSDEKIAVTDFGYGGTSNGTIPALRGWSWLPKCSHNQPLPPQPNDVVEAKLFRAYFNMFQLWSALAFSAKHTTPVLLKSVEKDGSPKYAYLSSQIYPFEKGHPFYIPPSIIEYFTKLENQWADTTIMGAPEGMANIVRQCSGKEAPQTGYFPASGRIRPWRVAAAAA